MTPLLLALLSLPLLLLAALWLSARIVNTPQQSAAEALVRLLYCLARWFQALAEAHDSAVIAYRDAKQRIIFPHCEQYRLERDLDARRAAEGRAA